MTEQVEPDTPAKEELPGYTPVSPIAWLIGAFSLFALIDDVIGPLELAAQVRIWVDAYIEFVDRAMTIVFGWLPFDILIPTEAEQHLLVLLMILNSTLVRGIYITNTLMRKNLVEKPLSMAFVIFALALITTLMHGFIPLLLPPPYGSIALTIFIILTIVFVFFGKGLGPGWGRSYMDKNFKTVKNTPKSGLLRRELAGTLFALAVLIALNYSGWLG